MKKNNIGFIRSKISSILNQTAHELSHMSRTTENDFIAEFIRSIGTNISIHSGNFQPNGFPVSIALEYDMHFGAKHYNFGPVDVVLFDNTSFKIADCVGFECKVFGTHYGTSHWKSVDFFFTGKHQADLKDTDYKKGRHLKNGHQTHCQEGQLLKDYIKAVKILSQKNYYCSNVFYLVGVIIYTGLSIPSSKVVKNNLKKLISPFSTNKHYSLYYNSSKYHSNRTENIKTTERFDVPGQHYNHYSNLTFFPYVIEITRI